MAKIAIIVGHARKDSFCEALAKAYEEGAKAGGHDVTLFVTSRMQFDPILHFGYEKEQPLEPDLEAAHEAVFAADHLVLVFPLWLGTLPAIFKGFLERILISGNIAQMKQGKFLKPLKGKSARVVMTMGMPGFVYRWYFGAHSLKMLKRNILKFVGISPVRSTIFGYIEGVNQDWREAWLEQMKALGNRAQ